MAEQVSGEKGAGWEQRSVQITADENVLEGNLTLVPGASGIVVFVHGSGSSRNSPRNQYVAGELQENGLSTLLFDLLTPDEEIIDLRTRQLRFDIDLLARRTVGAVNWLAGQGFARGMQLGLFGSSTGAAAALITAAERPELTGAVVSRGGRPDLAESALAQVRAPTLLIVGGLDTPVIGLNEYALDRMSPEIEARMEIVKGATHLFEEPGALARAARLAAGWFKRHLSATQERPAPG